MASQVEQVQARLRAVLAEAGPSSSGGGGTGPDAMIGAGGLTAEAGRALLTDMLTSRSLDVAARRLKAAGDSYYTISSAGHELNAVVGALTRHTDPAFLHYRSGGFVMARSRKLPEVDAVGDAIRSFTAAADDPIAQGRHKVWGSVPLWIPPQTSTIASHLPKATGAAVAIERARRLGHDTAVPHDSIVVCSFGDASANHATALTGINAARYAQRRGAHAPVVFVCEDNGIGISTDTPRRWIEGTFGTLPHLRYIRATGEVDEVWAHVDEAVRWCRETRTPVFLHLDTVRLWGHAGSDVEATYRAPAVIAADEARDPLARAGARLVALGAMTAAEAVSEYDRVDALVQQRADELAGGATLQTRAQVVAPLAPHSPAAVVEDVARGAGRTTADGARRQEVFGGSLPEDATAPARRTMAAHLNAALHDELARRPEVLVMGEDVGRKGGVYHVTAGLQSAFGHDRVFDTLLDETTILGVAQGAALLGFLPVPEIQYLAYVHNALDQIRGEAASLSFFSAGQYTNPMVVRVAGLAYQKGFGGHFHNDNAIGALRDIPGLAIACPSRGDEAVRLFRTAMAMAAVDGRVVAFLEPIALYHEKDLHDPGDGGWLTDYPSPGAAPLLPGEVGVHGPASGTPDVLLVSYANGLRMSLQAARRLAEEGIVTRVIDLRWLSPLPMEAVAEHARQVGRVLVVDECRATGGGVADALVAGLVEAGVVVPMATVRAADSFIPLGPAADTVLVDVDQIVQAAIRLAGVDVT
jgi:2-oxoisovalerate dehydrogenase E1 component